MCTYQTCGGLRQSVVGLKSGSRGSQYSTTGADWISWDLVVTKSHTLRFLGQVKANEIMGNAKFHEGIDKKTDNLTVNTRNNRKRI